MLLVLSGNRLQAQQRTATRSLDDWKKVLQEGELEARREAAIATRSVDAQLQRQLVPVFIELLRHEKDGQIRLAIYDTVSDMGPMAPETVPALMHAMRHRFAGNRNEELHQDYRAAIALSKIGAPASSSAPAL